MTFLYISVTVIWPSRLTYFPATFSLGHSALIIFLFFIRRAAPDHHFSISCLICRDVKHDTVLLNRSLELSGVAFLSAKMWAHACKLTRVEVRMLQTLHGDNVSAILPSSWGTQGQPALLCLLMPDILHSPGNSLSVCLKLNLTDATKSYKIFGATVLRDYTHFPPPCGGKIYLLLMLPGYCSQMECSAQCLAQHQPSPMTWWVSFFPHCYRAMLPCCLVSKNQLFRGTPTHIGTKEGQGRNY